MSNRIISQFNFYNYPVDFIKIKKIVNNLSNGINTYCLQSFNSYAFNLQIKFNNLSNQIADLFVAENINICNIYYLPNSLLFFDIMTNNIKNIPNSVVQISTCNNNYKKIILPFGIINLNLKSNSMFLFKPNKKHTKLKKYYYIHCNIKYEENY
jgi:hypothetical protein